jgi:hypothetical protein
VHGDLFLVGDCYILNYTGCERWDYSENINRKVNLIVSGGDYLKIGGTSVMAFEKEKCLFTYNGIEVQP